MGIINIVKNVKEIHKEFVVLVRVGNFYNCYGRDSYIISYLLGYKINILDNNIYNSSFPILSRLVCKFFNTIFTEVM